MKQREDSEELDTETQQESSGQITPGEIIIGSLSGISPDGKPLVSFAENPNVKPLPAVTTVAINQQLIGRQVALLFANGNLESPVIIGLIHSQLHELISSYQDSSGNEADAVEHMEGIQQKELEVTVDDAVVDGKRIVIEGKEEIVLKCGEASIVLTKSGKILIRGKYLLNRSAGVNRIMGGSVQVN